MIDNKENTANIPLTEKHKKQVFRECLVHRSEAT